MKSFYYNGINDEITNEQFNYFFPEHDSRYASQFWKDHTTRGYPINLPEQSVVRVSWEECQQFCMELSKKMGLKIRLPNEAEWEWACLAGTNQPLWYGGLDSDFSEFENLADESLADFAVVGVNPTDVAGQDGIKHRPTRATTNVNFASSSLHHATG